VTALFVHGGFLHIVSNMVVLFIFGDNVEDALGHGTFLLFYLATGVVAGLANAVLLADETAPGIGASGAIAGVLAAYLLLFPRARVRAELAFGPFLTIGRVAALLLIGFWFLTQLGQGIGSLGAPAQQGGVGYVAHVGGFVAGGAGVALVRWSRGQALGGLPAGTWVDRPFRNWLALVLGVGLLFGASTLLAAEGDEPAAFLVRGLVVLAVAAAALWDAWRRIGGRPSFLGAAGNLGRLLAFGQLVLVLAGLAALLFRLFY
jgi:membrane associated rhomboid family serine protease